MKSLHFTIIVILMSSFTIIYGTAFAQMQSTAATQNNQISIHLKPSYFAGDTITVTGTTTANSTSVLSLIDNHGILVSSAQVTSDKYGTFVAELAIPKDAPTSVWQVVATSGLEQESASVIVHSVNQTMPTYSFGGPTFSFAIPPLEQLKSGVLPQDVKCEQGFQLILKAEDNYPACVQQDNAEKLVQRGWAQSLLLIEQPKSAYATDEKIDLTINFKGLVHESCSQPHVTILDSNQGLVWQSTEPAQFCVSAPFGTPYYVDKTYNLLSDLGGPVTINQTGTYTVNVSFYNQTSKSHFSINSGND